MEWSAVAVYAAVCGGLAAVICLLLAIIAPFEGHWEAVPVCALVFAGWWGLTGMRLRQLREGQE